MNAPFWENQRTTKRGYHLIIDIEHHDIRSTVWARPYRNGMLIIMLDNVCNIHSMPYPSLYHEMGAVLEFVVGDRRCQLAQQLVSKTMNAATISSTLDEAVTAYLALVDDEIDTMLMELTL